MITIDIDGRTQPMARPSGRAPGNRQLTPFDLRESHDPHPTRPTRCICGGPLNLNRNGCIDSGWGWNPNPQPNTERNPS